MRLGNIFVTLLHTPKTKLCKWAYGTPLKMNEEPTFLFLVFYSPGFWFTHVLLTFLFNKHHLHSSVDTPPDIPA